MQKKDVVYWGTTKIAYHYSFSCRKTMAINVHPDLSITVVAPQGTSAKKIQEKIRKRAGWIKKSLYEFELYLPKQPPRSYVSGETHRYLGRQYRLRIRKGEDDGVKCQFGYFWVQYRSSNSHDHIKKMLTNWYKRHAQKFFNERFLYCQKLMKREKIPDALFEIRMLSARWGSCHQKGKIILNLDLIKAPIECIDYVILHELCHLKVHHHGSAFWQLLEKVMPNYKNVKEKLNHYADV